MTTICVKTFFDIVKNTMKLLILVKKKITEIYQSHKSCDVGLQQAQGGEDLKTVTS